MKVLLIQPPIRDFYLTRKRTVPCGPALLAGALRRAGHKAALFDALATSKSRVIPRPSEMAYLSEIYPAPDVSPFGLFYDYRHFGYAFTTIAKAAGESGAQLVGISSLFTPYAAEALQAAAAVKEALPRCRIVVGGHHATALFASVMAEPAVDFVIRGEGETALPALADALEGSGDLDTVPGLVYRTPDGLSAAPPAMLSDLSGLPAPDLGIVPFSFYRRAGCAAWSLAASRGCPLACTYCAVGSGGGPYRLRPVSAVLAELETAVFDHNAGFIDFEDENLSWNREWFMNLLNGLRQRFGDTGIELRAMNGLLPSTLDAEMVKGMKAAGFTALNLSVGSFSPSRLRRFRRPDQNRAFDHALDFATAEGLPAVGYVVTGAPDQPASESLKDLLALAERPVLAGVSVYYPAPGSTDFTTGEARGLHPAAPALFRSSAFPVAHAATRIETATLLRLARKVNFIKQLAQSGEGLPPPEAARRAPQPDDRAAVGRYLLARFLSDGRVRGMTPDGRVFEHAFSQSLADAFLEAISRTRVLPAAPSPKR